MKKLKVYEYAKCGTCVKAKKFLEKNKISFEPVAIIETPPSKTEIKKMLSYLKDRGLGINKLFNTSGVLYKEMKLSTKIGEMKDSELIDLLSEHGKLIKRPFVLLDNDGVVGFKEDEWKEKIL
jgi:arsenate reductase